MVRDADVARWCGAYIQLWKNRQSYLNIDLGYQDARKYSMLKDSIRISNSDL